MNDKVAQSFQKLYLTERTGLLACEGEDAKRALYFRSGFVVAARSSRVEDRLGELLIRKGRITKQQFVDASHFIKSGWKLGEILVELKIVQKDDVDEFVRIQLLEIACSVLIEPPRKITFSDLTEVETIVSPPVSVANIILEAARTTPHFEELKKSLLREGRRLGFSRNTLLRYQNIDLSPEEAYILSRIDGSDTAQGILSVSPLGEEQTVRTLVGLLNAGVIEPEGDASRGEGEDEAPPVPPKSSKDDVAKTAAAPERDSDEARRREVEGLFDDFQQKDHWEVLGLTRGASAGDIKKAFQQMALRYHPDRYRKIDDARFQEKISYVFSRVSEAHETLSTRAKADGYEKLAEKEAQYAEKQKSWASPAEAPKQAAAAERPVADVKARQRDPSEARALFSQAKRAYDLEDYWTTIQYCQRAIEIVGDNAEYYHLLGLAQARNPKWRLDAERNLKIATNLDPWKSKYLVALAKLYEQAGMHLRAQKVLEQANAIDPGLSVEGEG